ncbi:gamma-glutamyltransferase family protein [Roseococcus pinisoli]|uniref:Gamma-glutamyltransferase family protein n=1 Tax=Roseococcus pinisoli TaxID=2835040 RepID=A0ABS5QIT7_9PROT|nr:gamma-glutamyltransferase family protein [Roseococcus pinisoli]MBS7813597.1 gamma-glutamyltransferase family protein [Roseococcus pinisoli]
MARPERRLPAPRAMIAAPQPEAVEAGTAILAAGGNALDAALACALTQGVVDPMMCGIGGLGVLHILDPKTGDHLVLNGLSTCPAACTETMWAEAFERECPDGYGYVLKGNVNELGHRAVTTPGILRVFAEAHRRWGSKPWAELFGPAIETATEGWLVRPHVATMFALDEAAYGRLPYRTKLGFTEEGQRLYLRPDGSPKRVGDSVRNPELAATLATLAREGAEDFYTGSLARRIVADMEAKGGLITAADLAGMAPEIGPPLTVGYRGRTIAVPAPPAGGIMVAEILRILEHFDLPALGHNSAEYLRVVAEAMKVAGRDKDLHIGDPRFVPPPLQRLLSDAYAAERAAAIRAGEKHHLPRTEADSKHTTTISCVDADGMVVSMTHTLGVPSGVIPPGTGFMLNGAMNWCDPRPGRAGSIAPGKRRFSSMTPGIVLEEGKAVATLGAPGGAWIPIAVAQVLLNLLDFGMGMQEAVQAPRFSATSDAIDIGNRIPRAVQREVEAMGYEVRRTAATFPFAGVHGITMWDGRLEGGADPQRDGLAAGVP